MNIESRFHCFKRDRINGLVHPLSELLGEMPREQRNVFWAFAQRRNGNWKDVQSIVEVAPKLFLHHHLFQVAMAVFGAKERMRMSGPGGKIAHAEMTIGNAVIMVAEEFPEWGDPKLSTAP